MTTLVVIDTDILIDVARQVGEAVECLIHIEDESVPAVSIVTKMELLVGCRNKVELRYTERFLQRFQLLTLSAMIGDTALELLRQYRLSHGLLIPDALIAATAVVSNAPLISKNQRDYRFINELQLLSYPFRGK